MSRLTATLTADGGLNATLNTVDALNEIVTPNGYRLITSDGAYIGILSGGTAKLTSTLIIATAGTELLNSDGAYLVDSDGNILEIYEQGLNKLTCELKEA